MQKYKLPTIDKKQDNDESVAAGMGSGEGRLISEVIGNKNAKVPTGYSSAPSPGGFFAYFLAETRK